MSAQDANEPADEIDAFLSDLDNDDLFVTIQHRLPAEANFAAEAYYSVASLRESISKLQGLRDYCEQNAEIIRRLRSQGNDPEVLRARVGAHANRLEVELRALLALFYGTVGHPG